MHDRDECGEREKQCVHQCPVLSYRPRGLQAGRDPGHRDDADHLHSVHSIAHLQGTCALLRWVGVARAGITPGEIIVFVTYLH